MWDRAVTVGAATAAAVLGDGSPAIATGMKCPDTSRNGDLMKLKLGLLIGGAIGYLIGSGRLTDLRRQLQDRRSDAAMSSRVTTGTFRSEEPMSPVSQPGTDSSGLRAATVPGEVSSLS